MRPQEPGSIQAKPWFGPITPNLRSASETKDVSAGCNSRQPGLRFSNRPELVIVPDCAGPKRWKWSSSNAGQVLASPVREDRGAVCSSDNNSSGGGGGQAC